MQKLIITKLKERLISALYDEKDMIQVTINNPHHTSGIGNIYVGKVQNIVKNINAAFIEISNREICYLSLSETACPIFSNGIKKDTIQIGDEILVQVQKAAIKSKSASLTTNLCFQGKYLILNHGKSGIGISSKISKKEERSRIRSLLLPYESEEYGWILRTNSTLASEELLLQEKDRLLQLYQSVKEYGIHLSRFSLVYEAEPDYIVDIKSLLSSVQTEIITDDKDYYNRIKQYLETGAAEKTLSLRYYDDPEYPLSCLYNISAKLKCALSEKVWLKSGGNILIQPTEALTVIDVNTGKAIEGKQKIEATFLKINLEAAEEIAKQIRLRNISGIIIIDFINLLEEDNKKILMEHLRLMVKKDPVKTIVIGMTQLNLVELTRKKIRQPLLEQFEKYNEVISDNI